MRLNEQQYKEAVNISKALFKSKNLVDTAPVNEVINSVIEEINQVPSLNVEYFEIVDGNNLQPVSNWNDSNYIVGCITVFCGDVRLIDNIIYKN